MRTPRCNIKDSQEKGLLMEGLKPQSSVSYLDNTQTLEVIQMDISSLHLLGILKNVINRAIYKPLCNAGRAIYLHYLMAP